MMNSSLKKVLIFLAAAALIAIFIAVAPALDTLLQEPVEDQLIVLLDTSTPDEEAVAKAVELLKPLESQKMERAMDPSQEQYAALKSETLLAFCEVANRFADAGVLNNETANVWCRKTAEHCDPKVINSPAKRAWAANLLKRLDRADADSFMRGYVKKYTRGRWGEVFQFIVENRTIPELLEITYTPEKGESYNGSSIFMEDALADMDLAAVQQQLAELADPQLRSWLVRCATATRTQPNDVLAFLHLTHENGLSPADCYPDRVILDWDLTQLDPFTFASETGACAKWLPITITEQAESEEFEMVPDELFSTADDFESVYADDYESNDALGKDAFDIRLDMELLAAMPAEAIPETLEELDALLVRSTLYVREGTLRTSTREKFGDDFRTIQYDYPLYAALQTVDLYDMQSMQLAYRFAVNSVSPENQETSTWQVANSRIEVETSGEPDRDWMNQHRQDMRELLEASKWDLSVAMVNHALAALINTGD